jgi:hypothetical protein
VPDSETPEALNKEAVGGVVCVLLNKTNNMVASVAEMVTAISWSGLAPGAIENEFNVG